MESDRIGNRATPAIESPVERAVLALAGLPLLVALLEWLLWSDALPGGWPGALSLAAPLLVEAVLASAGAITAEAGLSFLGLGVQPPQASWGGLIREGARYLLVAPHYLLLPGMALVAVIYAISVVGEGLRRRFDPKGNT